VQLVSGGDAMAAPAIDAIIRLPPMSPSVESMQMFVADGKSPRLARLLEDAGRPVALTGIGAVRAKAGGAIRALAERVGCPVVVSPKAKGILSEDHPYFAGTLDMACNQTVWEFLKSADLI